MGKYITRLLRRELVAEGTMAFHFERPAELQFRAGQAVDLTLLNPRETDAEGNTRAFSLASAPSEKELVVATRMRDTAFKRELKSAPAETEVQIEGPTGSLTLHKNASKPAVLMAGGIGITPFFSIVKQAAVERLPHSLHLLYSNRRPEDTPFLDELQSLQKQNPRFRLIATMTGMEKSRRSWSGEVGCLNQAMLSRYLQSLNGPIYYIAGPPSMVMAMRKMLTEANVDEDDIRTEEFSGY